MSYENIKTPKVYLSEDQIKEAYDKYQDGATLRELGEVYGCSYECLRQHFKDMPSRVTTVVGRRLRNDHMQEFIQLISSGVTPEVAAGVFGCNKEALS